MHQKNCGTFLFVLKKEEFSQQNKIKKRRTPPHLCMFFHNLIGKLSYDGHIVLMCMYIIPTSRIRNLLLGESSLTLFQS